MPRMTGAEWRESATAIGGRCMGAEQAERFGRRNAVNGENPAGRRAERGFTMHGVAD
jgi:hypothetical protein